MFSFDLIEEKWLPCVMLDNSLKSLSLRDVLTDAHNIRELIGDSSPVTIALHRLLLAILHRALNAPHNIRKFCQNNKKFHLKKSRVTLPVILAVV